MQSYGDFGLIPNKYAISSSTCMDKRPIFGQIAEIGQKVVQYVSNLVSILSEKLSILSEIAKKMPEFLEFGHFVVYLQHILTLKTM